MSRRMQPGDDRLSVHARTALEQLRTTGYTASLGVLDGAGVLLIGRAASTRRGSRLIPNSAIGTRLPAHCTSMGKVLLVTLPEETWRSRLGDSRLVKHGPGTITSKSGFDLQLGNVRKRGHATSDQELWPERLAVAVPVLDEYGEVTTALSLAAQHRSMTSMPTLIDGGAQPLTTGASRLAERLGYRVTDLTTAG